MLHKISKNKKNYLNGAKPLKISPSEKERNIQFKRRNLKNKNTHNTGFIDLVKNELFSLRLIGSDRKEK